MFFNWIGYPVSVTFEDGETVKGWVYGELPQGYLISLDPDGKEIRLITREWRVAESWDAPPANFAPPEEAREKLDAANDLVGPRMGDALRRLNFTVLQNAIARAESLSRKIIRAEESLAAEDTRWLRERDIAIEYALYAAARTDRVVELHVEVYDELERVEIPAAVEAAAELLQGIPGEHLLPVADAASRREAYSLLADLRRWQQTGWTRHRHRQAIEMASQQHGELFNVMHRREDSEPHDEERQKRKCVGGAMRYFGAGLRILTGTGLAAANLGLGLTAGLASTLLTIGATAVPNYVGVVTSVGTGLLQVAEGLEKVGGIQKDEDAT
jgi:hypothetical protein